jgi:hypothetical protein
MISIRLNYPLHFDHFEISAGTVIAVPADVAQVAIQRGVAERTEPEFAVLEPQETRVTRGPGRPRRSP